MNPRKIKATLRRLFDRKRCRYSDCIEQHPLASDDATPSCASCRAYLGLEDEED